MCDVCVGVCVCVFCMSISLMLLLQVGNIACDVYVFVEVCCILCDANCVAGLVVWFVGVLFVAPKCCCFGCMRAVFM